MWAVGENGLRFCRCIVHAFLAFTVFRFVVQSSCSHGSAFCDSWLSCWFLRVGHGLRMCLIHVDLFVMFILDSMLEFIIVNCDLPSPAHAHESRVCPDSYARFQHDPIGLQVVAV